MTKKLKDYLYYSEGKVKLYNADCLDIMKKLPDNYVDLICTDPPYGISFMSKEWDTFNEVKDIQKEFGNTVYAKKGFKKLPRNKPFGMTKFFVPIWKEVLRILKPGAFAFVMCAPRQDVLSKQIGALQEAGFETGFSSIYWSYATGFPKASNISKKIDKQECKKELTVKLGRKPTKKEFEEAWKYYREVIGRSKRQIAKNPKETTFVGQNKNFSETAEGRENSKWVTEPKSPQAKEFDGSYGGFQPKPAVEIIIVAMKPIVEKTYVDQALKNGHGVTHLDNCRVPHNENLAIERNEQKKLDTNKQGWGFKGMSRDNSGRFPANLIVSDDVLNDGKITKASKKSKGCGKGGIWNKSVGKLAGDTYGDSGSFSRYFDLDAWWRERIKKLPASVQKVFPFLITPKASKSEKNKGCENLEEKLVPTMEMRKKPQVRISDNPDYNKGTMIQPPKKKNAHPTVKPIKLMSYLITLGSREGDIVLDPFTGSGTTGISAKLLDRKFIGVEMSKEYCNIAKARIKGW